MSAYKSEFLNVLATRGFIHQVSEPDALDQLAASSRITAYIGFDCTAASLHIGSLLPIMMLHWMQQTGHRPIALMGGGTTRVGDPSGKDESRRILTDDMINENLKGIRQIFSKFLKFEGAGGNAIMANNADWLNTLNYIDFLRDVGRHFSVNRMLSFDSVKMRLDRQQELSFLEFNYMILQAYDFVELNKRTGCVLQMGGSDQWGNIVNGIDLGRRMSNAQLFALTAPLITTSSGAKMGKTAAGAVWLNADMCSPYDYWQYWRNTEDGDVARFLKLFMQNLAGFRLLPGGGDKGSIAQSFNVVLAECDDTCAELGWSTFAVDRGFAPGENVGDRLFLNGGRSFVAGRINRPDVAERILAAGQDDLCAMTRGMVADPDLPNKARDNRLDDIRTCIACNQACIGHIHKSTSIS